MTGQPPTLEARVSLPLDRFVLDVDFATTHRVTGVFGASGAGKTSLLEAVAGLRRGAKGRVALGGETWADSEAGVFLPPERRDTGYVPQDGLLFPHLDVRGNLLAGARRARARGMPAGLPDEVADLLALGPLLDRSPSTLSGGERQRVALGRALCSGPRLLLFDEPLASLDLPLRRRILPFLRRVRDRFDVPMLVVTHDPTEAQALCDDLIVLNRGRVLARGEPRRVLSSPAVFPLARGEEFCNVVAGTVVEAGPTSSRVRLGPPACPVVLVTPPTACGPGGRVLLGIPAQEVLLSAREPGELSARNVLPGLVAGLEAVDGAWVVTVSLHDSVPGLAVEITPESRERLGLAPGMALFLIAKARSIRLYE